MATRRISLKPIGQAGIRSLSVKSGFLVNRSNRPGDDIKDELRSDGTLWRGRLGVLTEPALAVTST